ncbi:MAG TPA: DUF2238 domain-containing protein [Gemmatimonadales bacterium]|nr:DUF2238 domain-containing protein [Gemmatimonadales bacterium]
MPSSKRGTVNGERDSSTPSPFTFHRSLLTAVLAVLLWSAINPHDHFTWLLEVAPILIGLPIVVLTRKRFPLTPLAYTLLAIHASILAVGGHYTYAEVPAGYWVRDLMGWTRNNYDRLGHLAQGFIPAIVAREILLRTSPLRPGKWLTFLVICFCMALSSFYELIEWWTAAATGTAADAFLGTQGDPWDTQWDMMLAMIGACLSLLLLSRIHDRQLKRAGY